MRVEINDTMHGSPENTEGESLRPISRRGFLNYVLGGSLAATVLGILTPILSYLWPPKRGSGRVSFGEMRVATLSQFPVGKALRVNYNHKGVLVIRTKTGFSAVGLKCTHLGCNVEWSAEKNAILCPCHAGVFDVNGNVLSGPPPRPLPKFNLKVVDDVVFIVGGA